MPTPPTEVPPLAESYVITIGSLNIDTRARSVQASGKPIHLTKTEFDCLLFLAQRQGTVVTLGMFFDHLYGTESEDFPDPNIIKVFICKIRKKLNDVLPEEGLGQKYILTVWGRGYRLVDPTPESPVEEPSKE